MMHVDFEITYELTFNVNYTVSLDDSGFPWRSWNFAYSGDTPQSHIKKETIHSIDALRSRISELNEPTRIPITGYFYNVTHDCVKIEEVPVFKKRDITKEILDV